MARKKLEQINDNIWLWPRNSNPFAVQASVGVIVDVQECILVDAGNSPHLARQIKNDLERQGLPPVSRIIYTHHHWDHVYGACAFEVPVIAHTQCKTFLETEAAKPWGPEYLQQEVERDPKLRISMRARGRAIKDWAAFRIVIPEIVFSERHTIQMDQITVELEHVGGQHAADAIVVKVPQAGAIFLGDCYYIPPLHLRSGDDTPDAAMLAALESETYDLYIESHDAPFTHTELLELLEGMAAG